MTVPRLTPVRSFNHCLCSMTHLSLPESINLIMMRVHFPLFVTDDEEEEKKHHSIFDVVIDYSDYYVSMYDKVKRSNRACKNNTAQQKQQEEEKRKQEKVSESLKQLKQSRAKREEKKRSTSIEERKSMTNSSSDDDESHMDALNDLDISSEHRRKHHDRQSDKVHSSDDDERMKSSSSTVKSKSKRKMKSKSSRKDDEKNRKRQKRSNKSPSRSSLFSSSTLFSHSDDDSPSSSSHRPEQKKKKFSSSSSNRHQISSLGSSNNLSFSGSTKSSDDSHSEPENINDRKKMSTSSSLSSKSKQFVSFSDQLPINHQSKFNAQNIYSDSDSSDMEQIGTAHKTQQPSASTPVVVNAVHSSSTLHRSKSKEKSSKQKSKKQSLFDSTDSSDNASPTISRERKSSSKDKDSSTKSSSKSRDRDKENKNKKKHHHKSSSLKSSRKQYYNSGDASGDGSHASEKRDSVGGAATMEELFGPMTSSSDSEGQARDSDHERPKTPTVLLTTPSSGEDLTLMKKPKSSRHHHDKSPFSLITSRSESHSLDEPPETSSTHSAPHQSSSSKDKEKSSEKKKKKHHKEKRSKRGSTHEGTVPLSSQSVFTKQELLAKPKQESVDYDALFNSPAPSPIPDLKIDTSHTPISTVKAASISPIAVPKVERDKDLDVVPEIAIRAPTPQPPPVSIIKPPTTDIDECEKEMRGMFSSDDDGDDDKLKIADAITDAIRASADEQDIEASSVREALEDVDPEWKRQEEEAKKLNSLVEQDKAIESIVLLERKSPTPQSANPDEDATAKDDIPKDSTISQEETDVAVATILETLGNEEEEEDVSPVREDKPLLVGPAVAPLSAHSPPTLRIIEDAANKSTRSESSESNSDETAAAVAAIAGPSSSESNRDKEESREDPDPWGFDDNRSPKELQIDEGDVEETRDEEESALVAAAAASIMEKPEEISRSPEKVPASSFEENSVVTAEVKSSKSEENKVEPMAETNTAPTPPKLVIPVIKEESSKAGDVYEFHDSDDDKRDNRQLSHTRQTPPMISPPAKSPMIQASVPPPEPKLQSPPIPIPMPVPQPQLVPHIKPEKQPTLQVPVIPVPTVVVPTTAASAILPIPSVAAAAPPPPVSTSALSIPLSRVTPPLQLPSSTGAPTPVVTPLPLTPTPPISTPPVVVSSPPASLLAPVPIIQQTTPLSTVPPPPPPTVTKVTPPPQQVASRSTIDEAIDEVLRKLHSGDPLPFAESPVPARVSQPAQRAGRRSRSISKDSPDENAAVTRVMGRPDPHRHGSGQVLGVIGGHQMDTQGGRGPKLPPGTGDLESSKVQKESKLMGSVMDQVVTSMIQSEENRYIPILSQANDQQIRPGMHQLPQQIQLATRQTPVISRMMDREPPGRPIADDNKTTTPLLSHQQIPKHEGLTAMLAAQQQQQQQLAAHQQQHHQQQMTAAQHQQLAAQQQHHLQQQHLAAQHQQQILQRKPTEPAPYGFPPAQISPLRPPLIVPATSSQQSPSVSQSTPLPSGASPVGGGNIIRPTSTGFGISPPSHQGKVPVVVSTSSNEPSPTGIPISNPSGLPTSPYLAGVHPPPGARSVFVASSGSPGGVYPHQPQILQLSAPKLPERQSPRPSSRQTPVSLPVTPISQSGKPELVHLPEVPMATTVTKINTREEQQRQTAIIPAISSVVLTSTSGPMPTGPPFFIRTVVSTPSGQIQMTQQQLQQQRTLQEVFRRTAEGNIRVAAGKDESMDLGPRPTVHKIMFTLPTVDFINSNCLRIPHYCISQILK